MRSLPLILGLGAFTAAAFAAPSARLAPLPDPRLTPPDALAAPIDPEEEADLVALAEILGARHHLQTACVASDDETYRGLMLGLMRLEAPADGARYGPLAAAFNEGYRLSRDQHPVCSPQAAASMDALQARGARLADAMVARRRR